MSATGGDGQGRLVVAAVPVRGGVLPVGGDEAVAEAGGAAILIGSGCDTAARELAGIATSLWTIEAGAFAPARWAQALAVTVNDLGFADRHVLLPASPDGRDLGPRLAAGLHRAFVAAAIRLAPDVAEVTRHGGRVAITLALADPVVATLQPGARGVTPTPGAETAPVTELPFRSAGTPRDPDLIEELPADPSTMDLAEADRIVAGGAGLGAPEAFDRLRQLADALGASTGGTRVVTDWGWLPVERQIGTTGVIVDPTLYLAIGISGAVQHTAGLGSPDHIVSVNTDPHCPMMAMADLAVVCDGPTFLEELAARLEGRRSPEDAGPPEPIADQVT